MTRRTVPHAQEKAERAFDDARRLAAHMRRSRRPDLERGADAVLLAMAEAITQIVRETERRFSPENFSPRTGA